jgi:uncharacterized protein (DUF433 family)
MSTVAYPHIEVTSDGHARIRGTGYKVRMLAEEHLITGADAMELQRGHPQLSLNQVYSALAYYYDHKEAFDREIEELRELAERMRAEQGESLLAKKLRESGRELPQ